MILQEKFLQIFCLFQTPVQKYSMKRIMLKRCYFTTNRTSQKDDKCTTNGRLNCRMFC